MALSHPVYVATEAASGVLPTNPPSETQQGRSRGFRHDGQNKAIMCQRQDCVQSGLAQTLPGSPSDL